MKEGEALAESMSKVMVPVPVPVPTPVPVPVPTPVPVPSAEWSLGFETVVLLKFVPSLGGGNSNIFDVHPYLGR